VTLKRLRARLTYGNVMATIAVFIALGGSSYAALRITGKNVVNNSLTGADIKNNSLTGADVKNLASGDIANGKLLAEDFAPGQVLTPSQGDSRYLTPTQGDDRYLTPTQGDGRYLTPTQGDGRYLPASGQIQLNASPLTWQKISAAPGVDTLPQRPSIGATSFGGSSGALSDVPVAIEPTLPTVLVGKPLKFVGVNACYATDAVTTLDTVMIHLTTNAAGSGNTSQLLTDPTNRTDIACRDYTLPTPHALAPGEDVSLEYDVNYSTNAGFFTAGRATFIFEP
jgi:hypothetical protein